ncbi:tRNA wybutosine-synthesizing protein 4 [Merluccius polli]|uniref:tRNA wybutosine-synthesizing protein 4 n=1 Tax=Merluccius polli TaxID=89951 RepID=A0AA47P562_MERPO|nr:tRNA wybutosine-synthesizing protein 4 [Merluccius polli]
MPATNTTKRKQARDTAVQGTNDSSVVSKVSAAAQGYFQDAFIQHFVCKVCRRAPLINRGYYVRWRAVDYCVKSFLQATVKCPKRQILSLGAGFDSLFFRLHEEGALVEHTVVYEVDFPDVAQRKAALISDNLTLAGKLGSRSTSAIGPVVVSSAQYRLLGVDVREEAQVEEALAGAGLDWAAPTLLLSEVVLTYMETHWSDSVIGWAANHFPQSLFVMYEQIRPWDPFGQVMQDHFLKLNSTLHALQKYSDGWEQCVCLDMNEFYLSLVPEDERHRVESLEPFDEYEEWYQKCSHYFVLTASRGHLTPQALLPTPPVSLVPWAGLSRAPVALSVRTTPGEACVEGLGMAAISLGPGWVLLTGGAGKGSRAMAPKCLVRGQTGWRTACVLSSTDWGIRRYHTLTAHPLGGAVVYGGRSSPLNPIGSLLRVTFDPCDRVEEEDTLKVCVKEMACTGDPPEPRWRHIATVVSHKGKDFLFVFGGKNHSTVLGDGHFLCLDQQHWTEVLVEGTAPEARHSHTACPYQGGLALFGGLGSGGVPLGDTQLLKPTAGGFCWDRLEVHPPLIPRYGHAAHVIGDRLVVVGGVWLYSGGVPGIAVIDLTSGSSLEFCLDTTSVPWPLMLHSFCSELLEPEGTAVLLIGGGGNCFSFGTHLNPRPVTVDLSAVLG